MDNLNSNTQIKELILNYVKVNASEKDIDGDTLIFELGYVNSLFAIELMCYLEREFHIKINTVDLDMNNFNSVDLMCAFVTRKRNGETNS